MQDQGGQEKHLLTGNLHATQDIYRLIECVANLKVHHWPGNIRALEDAIVHAVVQEGGMLLEFGELERLIVRPHPETWESAKRRVVLEALRNAGNNRCRAAKALGISRTTLYRQLKQYTKQL